MAMAYIWGFMIAGSALFGIVTGRGDAVGAAAMDGAKAAVELCIAIGGITCFWTGVSEIMEKTGAARGISGIIAPLVRRLFPDKISDGAVAKITANVSANMLGLANAATPLGIAAARELTEGEDASDNLCTLVVLNTASVQLIPTTAAAIRSACGAERPFDILPAVWFTSIVSVTAGLAAARVFGKLWRR